MKVRLALGITLTLLYAGSSFGASAEPGRRAQEREKEAPRKVFTGEAVLRTDLSTLVVALDEADENGRTDGKVDQVFSLWAVEALIYPLALRDPYTEIEIRGDRARIVLHSEQREIDLLMMGAEPDTKTAYEAQTIRYATEFVRYSGARVQAYSLADFEAEPAAILKRLQGPRAAVAPAGAFTPPPAPDSGGSSSCKASCSISCTTGACSAACQPGHCASCTCSSEKPPSAPVCFCN
jgi:hypothetical protein